MSRRVNGEVRDEEVIVVAVGTNDMGSDQG